MKSSVLAGLFAGIISAVAATVALIMAVIIRLPWSVATLSGILTFGFLASHVAFEIAVYSVFGAIFGAIYSKYYDSTPGKGFLKGLVYGLILFLISNFYNGVLLVERLGYEAIANAMGVWWMGFFTLATYGAVLGALYRKPIHAVGKYDVKSGVFPSTVAGAVGGIVAIISIFIGVFLRVWEPAPGDLSTTFLTSDPSHHVSAIIVTAAFGVLFGVIYSMYYDSTPGKGILKGLIYGFILYLMSSVRIAVLYAGYGFSQNAIIMSWFGFFTWTSYGLVLSALYKK